MGRQVVERRDGCDEVCSRVQSVGNTNRHQIVEQTFAHVRGNGKRLSDLRIVRRLCPFNEGLQDEMVSLVQLMKFGHWRFVCLRVDFCLAGQAKPFPLVGPLTL